MEVHSKLRRALSSVRGPFEYSLLGPFTPILFGRVCCSDVLLVKYLLSQPSLTSAFVIVESKGSPPIVLYWVACWILGFWCSRGFIASLHLLHFGVRVQL
jgi:hypothetical protein